MSKAFYRAECRACPRLAGFLDRVKVDNPGYFCKPVPPFGPPDATLVIVGLAPGMHGANRTGFPFTGDAAGLTLYGALARHGFADDPVGLPEAPPRLHDCKITNAVRCLPPQNRPTGDEVTRCNPYLARELQISQSRVILTLGTVAHQATLRALGLAVATYPFAHGQRHSLPDGRLLFNSYHCSRYNMNTRRLTEQMFDSVFLDIVAALGGFPAHAGC